MVAKDGMLWRGAKVKATKTAKSKDGEVGCYGESERRVKAAMVANDGEGRQ